MMAVNAYGKIAGCQATIGLILILTLPIAWFLLKIGYPPTSVGAAFIITSVLCSVGRVFWMCHLFGESVGLWLESVVLPCLIVCAVATFAAYTPHWLIPPSFARIVCASVLNIVATLLAVWLIACDASEQAFIKQISSRFLNKMIHAYNCG